MSDQVVKYWFYLALLSIAAAYWVGTTHILETGGSKLFQLAQLSFGRNSQGNYPSYPK